jgi:hypothetical protein
MYNSHMTGEKIVRRDFLRATSKTAIAMTAASYSRVLGANEKVRLGLIGAGERGRHVMGQFQETGRVDVTGICDIYSEQIDKARQKAPSAQNFTDHRKLLEMKELDAVLIATPDHWHAFTYHRRPQCREGRLCREAAHVNH